MSLQQWVLRPRSLAERLTWVVFCVAVATLVRWLFMPIVGGKLPWMTFAFATLVSAVFGGRAAGMLTAVLGGAAGTALSSAFEGVGHAELVSVVVYLAAATTIVI